ncbi:MAG: asparagine synthase (glutamine-hydrolyzing) [Deltaproteobacteria bacterium]|nr:asparagine synthase (glutamine-hydrolyzing) [Deltaproteobacteria bacterium]
MCGICGLAGFHDPDLLRRMTAVMRRRGPDGEGFFETPYISLGHRRLSIIDLQTGSQPMFNEDSTICVVFNGEIYNYLELREDLENQGHRFATTSDTEVILHAYEESGGDFLKKLNGEFAIALWDTRHRRLLLARDRLGIRPLYYSFRDKRLVFASELRALLCWNPAAGPLSPLALDCYLSLRYVPSALTLIEGTEKLGPGCLLLLENDRLAVSQYWTPAPPDLRGYSDDDCNALFGDLLKDSVKLRMRSDVPLGAYLSGGIDSAAIVSLMQSMTPLPVRTFTIGGFGEDADERREAASLARHFGTEHRELSISAENYELLPEAVGHLSSPIGDAIILPTFLLARETSKEVKVVLSGEGADEILAGYIHHLALTNGHALEGLVPRFGLQLLRAGCSLVPATALNAVFPYPAALGRKGKTRLLAYLDALIAGDRGLQYLSLARLFNPAEKQELCAGDWARRAGAEAFFLSRLRSALSGDDRYIYRLLRFDLQNWLVDYTLAKQDALTMANSLEARVPYLDHRLVELALGLPARLLIRGLNNKIVLRRAMRGLLPERTVKARKKAFYIPTERCFGSAFDNFVRDVLLSRRFRERGLFDLRFVERRLDRVRSAELVENKQIMALLLLELWMRAHIDGRA